MNLTRMTLLQDYLVRSAERHPDKVALVCGERRLTYAELDIATDRLAATMVDGGVERGDRVTVFAPNSVECVLGFWAALKAGAVVSVINASTKADKLAWTINDSRSKVLISSRPLMHVVANVLDRCPSLSSLILAAPSVPAALAAKWSGSITTLEAALDPGRPRRPPPRRALDIDLASIIYTSGSTGNPKGVMLTHVNMLAAATSVSTYLEMREQDIIIDVLPLSFDYGLYQMIMAFRVGARLVLEMSFSMPGDVFQRMVDERVTGFPGVPTIFSMMADYKGLDQYDFSSVEFVTNTAAALSTRHIDFVRQLFPGARIYSMYGLTECKRCTYLPPEEIANKPLSVGVAIPNTELWLVDDQDRRLGPGEAGQLVIRGSTVMKGYWERPEETAEKLRPGPLPDEKVLYTGDICRLDEDGYLYFVGRMDDIIKSRGEKVAPKEVESVLYNMPGVRDAAVIGVEDKVLGQAVKAFVVPASEGTLTKREILAHCARYLENFMMPKFVELVPDLPRTTSGKIKKTELR